MVFLSSKEAWMVGYLVGSALLLLVGVAFFAPLVAPVFAAYGKKRRNKQEAEIRDAIEEVNQRFVQQYAVREIELSESLRKYFENRVHRDMPGAHNILLNYRDRLNKHRDTFGLHLALARATNQRDELEAHSKEMRCLLHLVEQTPCPEVGAAEPSGVMA